MKFFNPPGEIADGIRYESSQNRHETFSHIMYRIHVSVFVLTADTGPTMYQGTERSYYSSTCMNTKLSCIQVHRVFCLRFGIHV